MNFVHVRTNTEKTGDIEQQSYEETPYSQPHMDRRDLILLTTAAALTAL